MSCVTPKNWEANTCLLCFRLKSLPFFLLKLTIPTFSNSIKGVNQTQNSSRQLPSALQKILIN